MNTFFISSLICYCQYCYFNFVILLFCFFTILFYQAANKSTWFSRFFDKRKNKNQIKEDIKTNNKDNKDNNDINGNKSKIGNRIKMNENVNQRDKSDLNMTITEAEEDGIDASNGLNIIKKKSFCSIMQ